LILLESTNNMLVKKNITYCVLEARRIGICSKCGKGLCASLFVGFLNSGLAGKTKNPVIMVGTLSRFLFMFVLFWSLGS
jgi:hypothetical protein